MTRERPILFSAPMVRAILAGTKTQTRRALRDGAWWTKEHGVIRQEPAGTACTGFAKVRCPYGQPGDRLWVRETWNTSERCLPRIAEPYIYAADLGPTGKQRWAADWRPSIHMPRAASRITLEVTGVRVERVQDISEADAQAEGAPSADLASGRECIFPHQGTHRWGFRLLWESINGSWDANPWVWVIEFRRLP